MNKRKWYAVIMFMLVLCCGSMAMGVDRETPTKALSLCDLVANWKQYSRQTVRVRAIFRVGGETQVLYDPACGDVHTWVDLRDGLKGPYKKLDRILSKGRRSWVVFEGVFHGPEPFDKREIDPRLPAKAREWLEKSHRRYGHQGAFDSMIDVTRVVEASEVAADVPQ